MLLTRNYRPSNHPVFVNRQNTSFSHSCVKLILLFLTCFRSKKVNNYGKVNKCETLIISHNIGGNPSHKKSGELKPDNYFGNLFREAKNRRLEISIAYLDHRSENQVNSSLNLIQYRNLKIFIKSSLYYFKKLKEQKIKYGSDDANSIFNTFHYHDILDWMIAFSVINYISSNNIKKVLITFEGNIWEHNVIKKLKEIGISSIGYFHGPLRDDFLYNTKKNSFLIPDLLLLKSAEERDAFLEFFPNLDVIVVGSQRSASKKNINFHSHIEAQGANYLVVPEGLKSEVNTLVNFSLKLKKTYPTCEIVFRFHPNLICKKSIKTLRANRIKISTTSLDYDLEVANYCIYRGSTVCFQSVDNNCIPIYIDLEDQSNISPLKFLMRADLPTLTMKNVQKINMNYSHENFVSTLKLIHALTDEYPSPEKWEETFEKSIF